ncbi:hypothetical protein Peur_046489 [Populus x canadensis]|jgi:hypothetical protein
MCSGNPLFSLREGTTSNMTWGSEGASTISQSNRFSFENPRYTNLHVKAYCVAASPFLYAICEWEPSIGPARGAPFWQ